MTRTAGPLGVDPGPDGTFTASAVGGRHGPVFGGQLGAQSLAAAAGGLGPAGERVPHSLHLTFLAPGDASVPVVYRPTVVKRGRAFSAVRVEAMQGERLLATSLVSFHGAEPSDEYGVRAAPAPSPDHCAAADPAVLGGSSPVWSAVEARLVGVDTAGDAPSLRLWMRWRAPLPDEAIERSGALAWMTDLLMIRTAKLLVPAYSSARPAASLDHALWFHRPARADDWLLLEVQSLVRSGSRAFSEARVFAGGHLVATSTQESLMRA